MNPTDQTVNRDPVSLPSDNGTERGSDITPNAGRATVNTTPEELGSNTEAGSKRSREEGQDTTAYKRFATLLTVASSESLKLLAERPCSAFKPYNRQQDIREPNGGIPTLDDRIAPIPANYPSFQHPLLNSCFKKIEAKLPDIEFKAAHFLAPESDNSDSTTSSIQELLEKDQLDETFALGIMIYAFIYSSLPYDEESMRKRVPSTDDQFKERLIHLDREIKNSSQLPPTLKSLATLCAQLLKPNPAERLNMPAALYQISQICHNSLTSGSSEPLQLIADMGLLSSHIDLPEPGGKTLAHNAVLCGVNSAIPILEQNGISLETEDAQYQTPMMIAASFNLVDALQQLQQSGANPNALNRHGYAALHNAIYNSSTEAIKYLLPTDEAIFGKGIPNSALHFAALSGNVTALDLCLNSGIPHLCDINQQNLRGETPLILAIRRNSVEMVDALLTAGADINAWTEDRTTPLHFAIRVGNADIARRLIERNAQTTLSNMALETPLLLALISRNPEMIQLLIDAVHETDDYSISPSTHPIESVALTILTAYIDSKSSRNSVEVCDIHALTLILEKNNELVYNLPSEDSVTTYQEALSQFTATNVDPISVEQMQRKLLNYATSYYKILWQEERAEYIDDGLDYYNDEITVPVNRGEELNDVTRALPEILHTHTVRYQFQDADNHIAVDFGGLTKQILGDAIHQAMKENIEISGNQHALFEAPENSNGFLQPPPLSRTTPVQAYQRFGQLLAAALPTSVAIGPYLSTGFFNRIIDFSEKICKANWAQITGDEFDDELDQQYDQRKNFDTVIFLDRLCEERAEFIIDLLKELENEEKNQEVDSDSKATTDGEVAPEASADQSSQTSLNWAINRWFLVGGKAEDRQAIATGLKQFNMLTEDEIEQTDNMDNLLTEKLNDNTLISNHAEALENLKTLAVNKLRAYAAIALGVSQAPQANDHIIRMGAKLFQITLCGHKDLRNNMLEALQLPKTTREIPTAAEQEAVTRHHQASFYKVKRYIETSERPILETLCRFWTGYEQIGAGAKLEIKPELHSDLLKSSSCFNTLYLPIERCREENDFTQFKEYLDRSLATFMDDPNSFNAN